MQAAERFNPGRAPVLALRFGLLAAVIVAWQLIGDDSARINMPTFTRTLTAFWRLIASGELPRALVDSNLALVLGYLLALAIAVPVGIAMGLIRSIKALVNPYVIILLSTPLIAVLPILQALFGLGLATRTVVVLRTMQGLSGQQVKQRLGCSASLVSQLLHKGLDRLRLLAREALENQSCR